MKKMIASFLPILILPFTCTLLLCGAAIAFLVSSGSLLLLREEGRNKVFIIPLLLLAAFLLWLRHYHGKCCQEKSSKSFGDYTLSLFLYMLFSMVIGIAFIIYIFIPWWIPNYQGGPLLP